MSSRNEFSFGPASFENPNPYAQAENNLGGKGFLFHKVSCGRIGRFGPGEIVPNNSVFSTGAGGVEGHLHGLPPIVGEVMNVAGQDIRVSFVTMDGRVEQKEMGPVGIYYQGTSVKK